MCNCFVELGIIRNSERISLACYFQEFYAEAEALFSQTFLLRVGEIICTVLGFSLIYGLKLFRIFLWFYFEHVFYTIYAEYRLRVCTGLKVIQFVFCFYFVPCWFDSILICNLFVLSNGGVLSITVMAFSLYHCPNHFF